jgi:hypothetical protein
MCVRVYEIYSTSSGLEGRRTGSFFLILPRASSVLTSIILRQLFECCRGTSRLFAHDFSETDMSTASSITVLQTHLCVQ